jgi:hypothetical protein
MSQPKPDKRGALSSEPGAYWFGLSYESDLAYAERLTGKTRDKFIDAVHKVWGKIPKHVHEFVIPVEWKTEIWCSPQYKYVTKLRCRCGEETAR